MPGENLIEPIADSQPVEITPTEPQAEAPPSEEGQGSELPEEILRIPAFGPVLAGEPGAFSANIKALGKTDEGKAIAKHAGILQQSGINFYRALDKETGVVFNSLRIPAETLKQADEAGQLKQLAPEFNVLNDTAARSGNLNPVLSATAPSGLPTPPAPPVPQMSAGTMLPPPPASTQTKLAGARSRNLQEGSPTSGRAAQGRLLNNLLKPAI